MSDIDINSLLAQMQALKAQAQGGVGATGPAPAGDRPDFATMLNRAIEQVAETDRNASELAAAFEAGAKDVDLVQVMVAMQKSRVSFQALTEVRNRLLTAYQDVMNMQV